MKLKEVYIYRLEYEVPPDMNAWTAMVAAGSNEEAMAYIQRYWGKRCNFTSIGSQMRLDALSDSVLKQIFKLGLPAPKALKVPPKEKLGAVVIPKK